MSKVYDGSLTFKEFKENFKVGDEALFKSASKTEQGEIYLDDMNDYMVGNQCLFFHDESKGSVLNVHPVSLQKLPIKKEKAEDLEVGDVIDVLDGDYKTVLAVCGKVLFLSMTFCQDELDSGFTIKEINDHFSSRTWKIVQDTPLVPAEEMTLKEVCKELGRDIKIIKE